MNKYVRRHFIMEMQYFDGSKICAEAIVIWAKGKLRRTTTPEGTEILLIKVFGDDEFAVKAGNYIGKDNDDYFSVITEKEFNEEFVKIEKLPSHSLG